MPLEIQINFVQKGVFFAGEKLSVTLTLKNAQPSIASESHSQPSPYSSSPSLYSKNSYTSLTSTSALDLYRPLLSPSLFEPSSSSSTSFPLTPHHRIQSKSLPNLHTLASNPTSIPTPPSNGPLTSELTISTSLKPLKLLFGTVHIIGTVRLDSQYVKTEPFEPLKKITGCLPPLEANEYPVLITQPSLLFMDLSLAPNQLKTYEFHMLLPSSLPPSFRGKTTRFTYKLVVQLQPFTSFPTNSPPWLRTAPFRLFPTLQENGVPSFFNLIQPFILTDQHQLGQVIDPDVQLTLKPNPPKTPEEIFMLLQRLDNEFNEYPTEDAPKSPTSPLPSTPSTATHTLTTPRATTMTASNPVGSTTQDWLSQFQNGYTLRRIQTFLTQASSLVFDLSHQGTSLAKLQLPRSIFRLGELIQGCLDFRPTPSKTITTTATTTIPTSTSTSTVIHISIILESLERVLDSSSTLKKSNLSSTPLSNPTSTTSTPTTPTPTTTTATTLPSTSLDPRLITRHAETHSNVQTTLLWPFELAIPESAGPSFECTTISFQYQLTLEFLVSKSNSTSFFCQDYQDRRHTFLVGEPTLDLEVVTCHLPLRILPALFTNYQDHVAFVL